jgi:putative hydrolase of the HAD superfamily
LVAAITIAGIVRSVSRAPHAKDIAPRSVRTPTSFGRERRTFVTLSIIKRVGTIRAVLFDLDDTLFDHLGCAREALSAIHQSQSYFHPVAFEEFEHTHANVLEELHQDVMVGRTTVDAARIERFRRLLESVGVADQGDIATELATLYRTTYRSRRRAVAGAARVMAAVKERARIGIVSNNVLDEQQEKLRVCSLDQFVDELVVSGEVGVPKPDPHIFRVALDRLNVRAEETVMVGDSWTADIEGARAAGIRAIWFNPAGVPAPDPRVPIQQLRSFEPTEAALDVIFGVDGESR